MIIAMTLTISQGPANGAVVALFVAVVAHGFYK